MADPEEDKNKAATPSEPGTKSDPSKQTDANVRLQSAAEKPPSNEATQDLLELLGTVGSAGLGTAITPAKIQAPPPTIEPQQTVESEKLASTAEPAAETDSFIQPDANTPRPSTQPSAPEESVAPAQTKGFFEQTSMSQLAESEADPVPPSDSTLIPETRPHPEASPNSELIPNPEHSPSTVHSPATEHSPSTVHSPGTEHCPSTAHSPGTEHSLNPEHSPHPQPGSPEIFPNLAQTSLAATSNDFFAATEKNNIFTKAISENSGSGEMPPAEQFALPQNVAAAQIEAREITVDDEHGANLPGESHQQIVSEAVDNFSTPSNLTDTPAVPPESPSKSAKQTEPSYKSNEAAARTVMQLRNELYPGGVPETVKAEESDDNVDAPPPLSNRFADQARKSMRSLAQLIPNEDDQTRFQMIAPGAVNELSNGTLGSATVAIFALAERLDLAAPLLSEYKEIAKNGPSSLEILRYGRQANEIHFRIRGTAPAAVAQHFLLRLVPKTTAELKAQFVLRDRLDLDPLTTRNRPPDIDCGNTQEINTLSRAMRASQRLIDAPTQIELDYIELPPQNRHILEFAQEQGAVGDNLNLFLRCAFYKTNSSAIRQQIIQGLRDEIIGGENPSAIFVFQELWVNKALTELKEYQEQNDEQGMLDALTQIIALEDSTPQLKQIIQNIAGEFRDKAVGNATVQQARRSANEIAHTTFALASQAYESFFASKNDLLPAGSRREKRLDAIFQLQMASEQRLNLLGRDDFKQLINSLAAVNAVLAMTETDEPAVAGAELSKLSSLHLLNGNADALHYLKQIHAALQRQPNSPSTETILKALLSDSVPDKQAALNILKSSLPNIHSQVSEFRLQLLAQRLQGGCNSIEINEIATMLEEEETVFQNQAAANVLRWARSIEASHRIGEAIKSRNLEDIESVKATAETIRSEMERLSQMTLQANEHARAALISMLLCGTEAAAREHFKKHCEYLPYQPELELLSATERSIIREHAALSIEESLKKNPNTAPLKISDAEAIATALAETYANGDLSVEKATESVFDSALKCLSRGAAIDGLLQAMEKDLPGTAKLSDLILKALLMPEALTQAQRLKLAGLARDGIRGAIRTLAALSASESPHAASAANELIKAGATSSNRDLLLSVMLDYYLRNADKHSLLSALGDIASRDYPVRPLVMETIRQALETSASRPDSPEHKSAQKGFIFLAENWSTKEIETLRSHLKLEMLAALPTIADKLAPGIRGLFIEALHEVLIGGNADERLAAVQALAALGRFTGPDLAADMGFFVTPQGRVELERCGMNKEKLNIFIDFAARALLAMLASANPKVQEAAVDAFRRQGDWPGILNSLPLRNMIIDYVQGRSIELENNKEAMQFVYEASLGRPLTAVFRELGVGGEKISTQQLLQLADKAASNYTTAKIDGRAVVQKVLANAVTFNALTEKLRERLTGFSNEIDLNQLAGQLINGTIDAHSTEFKFLFYDLHKRLRDDQQALESQAASLQVTRSEGEKLDKVHTVEQHANNVIGLGKHFRDCYGVKADEGSRDWHEKQEASEVGENLFAARSAR